MECPFVVEGKTAEMQEAVAHGNCRDGRILALRSEQGFAHATQTTHSKIGQWQHIDIIAESVLRAAFVGIQAFGMDVRMTTQEGGAFIG